MKIASLLSLSLITLVQFSVAANEKFAEVNVPAGIDNSAYARLLKMYVSDRGLIAYQAWKSNAGDRAALSVYISQFASSIHRHKVTQNSLL